MAPKKTVMVRLEFGVRDLKMIEVILAIFEKAARKFGGCDCFDVWNIEVDGVEHDTDSPTEALW